MKKLIAFTIITAGILLILVPRFILPACEYEGFSRMHCSDTAIAVMLLGAVLVALGGAALLVRTSWLLIADALIACAILGAALFMPDIYGYCASRNMPCHYGMVPGVRFIAVLAMTILIIGAAIAARDLRKKRRP